jgi:hypothetical protein
MLVQALPFLPILGLATLWLAGRLAFRMEG